MVNTGQERRKYFMDARKNMTVLFVLVVFVFSASPQGIQGAAKGGLADFVNKFFDRGAKVNIENVYGKNPELKGDYLGQKKPGLKPEIFAPGIISTSELNERDVSFSSDGKEFYFTQWPQEGNWDIMFMRQENGQWTEPQKTSFSGNHNEAEAFFTPDEQQLFFISNRPKDGNGNPETWEIWFVKREGKEWGTPRILGSPFEGGYYTTFTKDWVMYYTAINAENADLFLSKYVNGKFGEPERLGDNVNTGKHEYNSFIAPDESFLIFTSDGWEDGYGEGDLYICFRREDGIWTRARNMGLGVNSSALDYCPSVSPDGKYFFFSSRRLGSEDIFWVDAKIIEKLRPVF
jgi:Tol biopolymer transport system component